MQEGYKKEANTNIKVAADWYMTVISWTEHEATFFFITVNLRTCVCLEIY